MADTKPESKPADLEPLKWLRRQMGSDTGEKPKGFGNKQEDLQLKQLDEEPAAPSTKPDQSSHAGHVHNAIDFLQQALVKTGSHTPDGLAILDSLRSLGKHFGERKAEAAIDPALADVMRGKQTSNVAQNKVSTGTESSYSIPGFKPDVPGNIDIMHRPIVKNKDGSISTVRSMSFNVDGKEVLVPTISEDGKIMTDREAIDAYMKTGKNLGKFKDVASANAYAKALHKQQEEYYQRGRTNQ